MQVPHLMYALCWFCVQALDGIRFISSLALDQPCAFAPVHEPRLFVQSSPQTRPAPFIWPMGLDVFDTTDLEAKISHTHFAKYI